MTAVIYIKPLNTGINYPLGSYCLTHYPAENEYTSWAKKTIKTFIKIKFFLVHKFCVKIIKIYSIIIYMQRGIYDKKRHYKYA